MGAVEFESNKRSLDVFDRCFEKGVLLRSAGNCVPFAPPLVMEKAQIDQIVDVLGQAIRESAEKMEK
jgi:beta-alanine--pyruvate transaminase